MFPVCSATPSCSSHAQTLFHSGLRPFTPFRKDVDFRCNVEERVIFGLSKGVHFYSTCSEKHVTKSLYSHFNGSTENSVPMGLIARSCSNELDHIKCRVSGMLTSMEKIYESQPLGSTELKYVANSGLLPVEEGLKDIKEQLTKISNDSIQPVEPETIPTFEFAPKNIISVSNSLDLDNDSLSNVKSSLDDVFAGVKESLSSSLIQGENSLRSSLDAVTSLITSISKDASTAADKAVSRVFSTADQTGELAGNKLTNFSSDIEQASSKATLVAVDLLRRAISAAEDSILNGASFLVYSYGYAKELLPQEIRVALNSSEERVIQILRPVGTALQQVYITVEDFERNLGFNPDDPIVPIVLLLGTSASIWVFYWVQTYGGYSGDLSPKSTLELLAGKEKAVLIDVRPEVLREKDGIPDLRRAARSRYASVTLPEVDSVVRKMLNSGKDLDNSLLAVIIRNLKIVQGRPMVIVMDADGTSSKGIARSLRKLGVKRPYLVQGGFRSWVKEGVRVKELKPETAFTILSEDAEQILEDVRPSPLQVLGFGAGCIAASYALLEWEKTLQLIGVVGLTQTVYRRIASYEGSDDFQRDVSLLLAPVRVGAEAFTWAAGKLETNLNGLPTSPSSSDVQSRVLQAAAKHELQPSDTDAVQESSSSSEGIPTINENIDLSEA